jgi:SAM-dependent methyltransferase
MLDAPTNTPFERAPATLSADSFGLGTRPFDPAAVASIFDRKAPNWAAKRLSGKIIGDDRMFDKIVGNHVPPGSSVVDLGCGDGKFARRLCEVCRPRLLVAVDLARAMITRAARELDVAKDVTIVSVISDAAALALPSAMADIVILRQLLHHVPEPKTVIAEAGRVLRTGGELMVLVPGPGYLAAWDPFEGAHDHDGIGRFSAEEVDALLTQAGLLSHVQLHPFKFRFTNLLEAFERLEGTAVLERISGYHPAAPETYGLLLTHRLVRSILAETGPVEVDAEYIIAIGKKRS